LGQEGTEELIEFEDKDAVPAEEQDRNVPLANQNFNSMSGQIKSVYDEQEFCAECKKPVKAEWKACPFCGEFLEIYED
jgi:rRNA maturation endonuclease Nob1